MSGTSSFNLLDELAVVDLLDLSELKHVVFRLHVFELEGCFIDIFVRRFADVRPDLVLCCCLLDEPHSVK